MGQLLDRRNFLKDAGVFAVSAAILGSSASAAAASWEANPSIITAVLYDERYSDCRSFADAFVRRGATAFNTRDDIAKLWYGSLRSHLARCGGIVAGLTTHSDLVVSQSCGLDLNLNLLYEGSHDCRASDALIHRVRVRGNDDEVTAALMHANADWARPLADALDRATWNSGSASLESATVHTSRSDGHPGFLSSWVLGPAGAAA